MELADQIRTLAQAHLKDASHFVVDVVTSLKGSSKKVLITLDGDNGISIDDCADLSRELSKVLDDSNLIDSAFVLEVSTPGLDQPLKTKRQYVKNIGRKVRVKTKERTIEGVLSVVNDLQIEVTETIGTGKKREEKTTTISFQDIDKTFVLVSFK